MQEVTADVVEIGRELELELEPKDVTELLQPHDITWMYKELLLWMSKKKWLLELESVPDKDDVKIVEISTKDLEYYINLYFTYWFVDKLVAGFWRLTPILQKVLLC